MTQIIKLFNTASRKVENFKPRHSTKTTLYTCGPTVYGPLHIGNWSAYIRWDILVRVLTLADHKVERVMNITDVGHLTSDGDEGEDKMEKGARREGQTAWQVADNYISQFMDGMDQLQLLAPTNYARATDFIKQQIDLIKKLEQAGYTYLIDDGLYYDTQKFADYADFGRLNLANNRPSDRLVPNPQKHHPSDFALWKLSPKTGKRDMEWDSPWGKGFPGWHIECSAIAMHFLGPTLDIHTGGIDHIPVHHTNEIAQSEAATNKTFANFWLHNNFLLVQDTKISKSLDNSILLGDLTQEGFTPLDFKMLVLQSHYRSEASFSWDNLESAHKRHIGLMQAADLQWQAETDEGIGNQQLQDSMKQITDTLFDDMNTPRALSLLSELMQAASTQGVSKKTGFLAYLKFIDEVLGLQISKSDDLTKSQLEVIVNRQKAREDHDWDLADQLRQQLQQDGIEVRDTDRGQVWYRLRNSISKNG